MVAMCAGPESGVSSTVARASSASSCGSVSLATWLTSGVRACLTMAAAMSRSTALGPPHRMTRMPCLLAA